MYLNYIYRNSTMNMCRGGHVYSVVYCVVVCSCAGTLALCLYFLTSPLISLFSGSSCSCRCYQHEKKFGSCKVNPRYEGKDTSV